MNWKKSNRLPIYGVNNINDENGDEIRIGE